MPERLNSSPLREEHSTWQKEETLSLHFPPFLISRSPILIRRQKEQSGGREGAEDKMTSTSYNLSGVLELRSSLIKPTPQSFFILSLLLYFEDVFFLFSHFKCFFFSQSSMKK